MSIFLVLAALGYKKNQDFEENGVQNICHVTLFKHVHFIDNAQGQQTVSYYIVEFEYEFQDSGYSKKLELKPEEVKEKLGRLLNPGDRINIVHSKYDPENVQLIKNK
jgi:hypothetical protein